MLEASQNLTKADDTWLNLDGPKLVVNGKNNNFSCFFMVFLCFFWCFAKFLVAPRFKHGRVCSEAWCHRIHPLKGFLVKSVQRLRRHSFGMVASLTSRHLTTPSKLPPRLGVYIFWQIWGKKIQTLSTLGQATFLNFVTWHKKPRRKNSSGSCTVLLNFLLSGLRFGTRNLIMAPTSPTVKQWRASHSPPDFDTDWSPASVGWFFIHRFGMDLLSGFLHNFFGSWWIESLEFGRWTYQAAKPWIHQTVPSVADPWFYLGSACWTPFCHLVAVKHRKERQITTSHVEDVEHVYVNIYIYIWYM